MIRAVKELIKRLFRTQFLNRRIERHRTSLSPNEEFRVIFGGHWSDHPGWLVITEAEQDITRPLLLADESVDVVYTEHVLEHVSFSGGVAFLREAKRILKPGGVFRAVSPMLDRILTTSFADEAGRVTVDNVANHCREEDAAFSELEPFIRSFPQPFYLNSLFRSHGHKFIWSAALMRGVMKHLGYREVRVCEIGQGGNPEHCIERRRRGLYLGYDWREDRAPGTVYDAESVVIAAQR